MYVELLDRMRQQGVPDTVAASDIVNEQHFQLAFCRPCKSERNIVRCVRDGKGLDMLDGVFHVRPHSDDVFFTQEIMRCAH